MTKYAFVHKWHIWQSEKTSQYINGQFLCGLPIQSNDKLVDYHDEPMCKRCKQIQEKEENTLE